MYVDPPDQTVAPGTVSVDIVIEDAVDLGGYLFMVTWDASVLDLKSITDGSFLGSTGRTVLCAAPALSPGSVTFTCSSVGLSSGRSGNGVLATLQFSTLTGGTSPVVLVDAKLSTTDLVLFDIQRTDGSVTVTTPSPTPTVTNTATPTPMDTPTTTPTPVPTATPAPTDTPTPVPTATPTVTPAPTLLPTGNVHVLPVNQTVSGPTASVDITIAGASDLGVYAFVLSWDASILDVINVTDGGFIGSTGLTVTCDAPQTTPGSLAFGCHTSGAGGPNGSGLLATVQFAVLSTGTTAVSLSALQIDTTLGQNLAFNTNDGTITVQ
jgi:hypothetical protein